MGTFKKLLKNLVVGISTSKHAVSFPEEEDMRGGDTNLDNAEIFGYNVQELTKR